MSIVSAGQISTLTKIYSQKLQCTLPGTTVPVHWLLTFETLLLKQKLNRIDFKRWYDRGCVKPCTVVAWDDNFPGIRHQEESVPLTILYSPSSATEYTER